MTTTATLTQTQTSKPSPTVVAQMLAIHRRLSALVVNTIIKGRSKFDIQLSNDKDGIEIEVFHYKRGGVEIFSIEWNQPLAVKRANEQAIAAYLKQFSA